MNTVLGKWGSLLVPRRSLPNITQRVVDPANVVSDSFLLVSGYASLHGAGGATAPATQAVAQGV